MLFLVRRLPSALNDIFLTLHVSRSLIAFVALYLLYNAIIPLVFFTQTVSKSESEVVFGHTSYLLLL